VGLGKRETEKGFGKKGFRICALRENKAKALKTASILKKFFPEDATFKKVRVVRDVRICAPRENSKRLLKKAKCESVLS